MPHQSSLTRLIKPLLFISCKVAVSVVSVIGAYRKMHPVRAKFRRLAIQALAWAPSAMAARVLFFYPVATHLPHPRAEYLRGFHIPVPWTFTILQSTGTEFGRVVVAFARHGKGRLGMTSFPVGPFWRAETLSSIGFWSTPGTEGTSLAGAASSVHDAQARIREFRWAKLS